MNRFVCITLTGEFALVEWPTVANCQSNPLHHVLCCVLDRVNNESLFDLLLNLVLNLVPYLVPKIRFFHSFNRNLLRTMCIAQ